VEELNTVLPRIKTVIPYSRWSRFFAAPKGRSSVRPHRLFPRSPGCGRREPRRRSERDGPPGRSRSTEQVHFRRGLCPAASGGIAMVARQRLQRDDLDRAQSVLRTRAISGFACRHRQEIPRDVCDQPNNYWFSSLSAAMAVFSTMQYCCRRPWPPCQRWSGGRAPRTWRRELCSS
jgi:hypothetical protein